MIEMLGLFLILLFSGLAVELMAGSLAAKLFKRWFG